MERIYDSTQCKTYTLCPFKYYLKFESGLVPKDQKTVYDIVFGQLVHKGLQTLYEHLKDPNNPPTLDTNKLFEEYEPGKEEKSKTKEGGVVLLTEYGKRWKLADHAMKIHDVERVRTIDIHGRKFIVKLDAEVEQNENFYSLEHKTTSQIGYNYFDQYYLDMQMSAQAEAIRQIYGHCSGVILNALSVKFYLRRTKDNEVGWNTDFQRYIVNRTTQELDDWKININDCIANIEKDRERGFFRKALCSTACNMYRGLCSYSAICKCSQGMEVDEQIVGTMYDFENPYKYLEEELEKENAKNGNQTRPSETEIRPATV